MKDRQMLEQEIFELDRAIEDLEEALKSNLAELHGLYRLREFKELLLRKIDENIPDEAVNGWQPGRGSR